MKMKNTVTKTRRTLAIITAGLMANWATAEYAHEAEIQEIETNIIVGQKPIFPHKLIQSGYTEGKVNLIVEIDHHGELRDYLVVYSSHRDFARAVEYVIETWDFTPPKWNGKPISIVRGVEVNFQAEGALIEFNLSSGLFENVFNQGSTALRHKYKLAEVDDLDRFPQVLQSSTPAIPEGILESAKGKKAVFSFFVDTSGDVRMAALSKADPNIDVRALVATQDALTQWKFEKPKANGRPVVIQLAQPFFFNNDNEFATN